jgi:hypothetical protein
MLYAIYISIYHFENQTESNHRFLAYFLPSGFCGMKAISSLTGSQQLEAYIIPDIFMFTS